MSIKRINFLFLYKQVAVNISIESPQPSDITEVMKNKAKELRSVSGSPLVMKNILTSSHQITWNLLYALVLSNYLWLFVFLYPFWF